MLRVTQDLIQMFQTEKPFPVISAAVEFIIKFGSVKDVNPLLDLFLQEPTDFDHLKLLEPIMVHGNQETAERIFRECFDHGELKENMPVEILSCLGYLEYEPILPILMKYMTIGIYIGKLA